MIFRKAYVIIYVIIKKNAIIIATAVDQGFCVRSTNAMVVCVINAFPYK